MPRRKKNPDQGELFPTEKKSKTTPAQKTAAQQRKKNRAERKTRMQGRRMEEEARRREWKRRVERGEGFGDMPPDFLQYTRQGLQIGQKLAGIYSAGRSVLRIINSLP